MRQNQIYQYYVEGDTEEKMVSVLKTDYKAITPGKVEKFNVVCKRITRQRIMTLKPGTIVILVFDTDTDSSDILNDNIKFLKEQKKKKLIKDVICVTQVQNLEDELKRSCKIRQIKELCGSKSNTDFKRDVMNISNLRKKLDAKEFDLKIFWSSEAQNAFKHIHNESNKIKR